MKMVGFFDIETKNTFEDIDPKYPNHSWARKKSLHKKLAKKLKMACGCVVESCGKKHEYEESGVESLLQTLNKFDKIVGYNIINFDYLVLEPYDKLDTLKELSQKTLDLFQIIKQETKQYPSLNDLAKLNLGLKKTEDSKQIPRMWSQGKKRRVKKYCYNDVKILKHIYEFGLKNKKIRYYTKSYGNIIGVQELKNPW